MEFFFILQEKTALNHILSPLLVPRKEVPMFVLIVSICLLFFISLAGADLLVSNIHSDELSDMGVEEKL